MGIAGYFITIRAGFWLASILGIFVIGSTSAINGRLIDHDLARGLQPQDTGKNTPSGMAMLVERRADRWGRKAIFLAAFIALPLRGLLFTLSNNSIYLVGVQILDGVGAGIFGAGIALLALLLLLFGVPETAAASPVRRTTISRRA